MLPKVLKSMPHKSYAFKTVSKNTKCIISWKYYTGSRR